MFYCEFCRVQLELNPSAGWPHMGVSRGRCELCGVGHYCHDRKLPAAEGTKEPYRMMKCAECNERHYGEENDYLCTFCRGIHKRPDPDAIMREADAAVKAQVEARLAAVFEKERQTAKYDSDGYNQWGTRYSGKCPQCGSDYPSNMLGMGVCPGCGKNVNPMLDK